MFYSKKDTSLFLWMDKVLPRSILFSMILLIVIIFHVSHMLRTAKNKWFKSEKKSTTQINEDLIKKKKKKKEIPAKDTYSGSILIFSSTSFTLWPVFSSVAKYDINR